MSGLLDSLASAATSLSAQRMGLDVAGQNISNINTPGYTRRTLDLAALPSTDALSAGGGVSVLGVRALRDDLASARFRRESGDTAHDAGMAEILGTVEAGLGTPGSSLDQQLTAFFDAFSNLTNDPTSLSARDEVVRQATQLSSAFHGLVSQLDHAQQDADASIRASVDEVNQLGAQLAKLNADLAAGSYDADAIKDRQNVILDRLSELAGVSVLSRPDGEVDVTLASGRAIVIGENAYALTTNSVGLASVTLGDVDVTSELTGGRIGGLLQARDVVVPGYVDRLDQLAYSLATSVNAIHNTGFDATGAAAGDFFAAPTTVSGAANALAVDPSLVADSRRVAASATGAIGDNQIAQQLAALRSTALQGGSGLNAFDQFGGLVYAVGSDVSLARSSQASHDQVMAQLDSLRQQTSGVSYDEEAAHLMRFQRAYEANAQYFKTIADTLDTLINMVQ